MNSWICFQLCNSESTHYLIDLQVHHFEIREGNWIEGAHNTLVRAVSIDGHKHTSVFFFDFSPSKILKLKFRK